MDNANFIYDKQVSGKNFIGRVNDCNALSQLLSLPQSVALWEPPKSGKTSLIHQTLYKMKLSGVRFCSPQLSLLSVRSSTDFALRLGSAVLQAAYNTPDEYAGACAKFLGGTHLVFDPQQYSERASAILSANWDLDGNDLRAVLALPRQVAADTSQKVFVVVDEFQNIMLTEDGESLCALLQEELKAGSQQSCYVLCGSEVNAMKEIFEHRKLFFRTVEHLPLSPVEPKEIIDKVVKGFLSGGKVVDRELMLGVCRLFKGNLWYINQHAAICDSLSKGYILEPILVEALGMLISTHEPRFKAMVSGLTTFQVSVLRAILDGNTRLSSAEVIQRYSLNSSANVRRLKDALCRKEIVTFETEEKPVLLDPLFEYWVRKEYFGMEL